MAAASYPASWNSTIALTGTRVPAMHGAPDRISGVEVMAGVVLDAGSGICAFLQLAHAPISDIVVCLPPAASPSAFIEDYWHNASIRSRRCAIYHSPGRFWFVFDPAKTHSVEGWRSRSIRTQIDRPVLRRVTLSKLSRIANPFACSTRANAGGGFLVSHSVSHLPDRLAVRSQARVRHGRIGRECQPARRGSSDE